MPTKRTTPREIVNDISASGVELKSSETRLSTDTFAAFLNGCKLKQFSAKEIIFREGQAADTVYAIRNGMIKLLSYLPNGRARIVRLHGKGAWVGLEGLIAQSHEHTAVAVDDVNVYCLPVSHLLALKLDEPQHFFQLMEKWYEHLREADLWIAEFSTGAVKPRVARLINFLATIEFGKSANKVELLTVHEMADILGVTAESVSRTIADFKRHNILNRVLSASHELYELDTGRLHSLAKH